jgi:hypothetical protein
VVTARRWRSSFLLLVLCSAPAQSAAGAGEGPEAAGDAHDWAPIVEPWDATVPEPPEGRWLVDENGLEYTLFRWRKHEGYYRFADDSQKIVVLSHGVEFRVERHDETFLFLRWYRAAPPSRRPAEARPVAAYRTALPERDRLRLASWDHGLPRAGQWRNGFAVADFDGDGHLDLAHGPPRKGSFPEPVVFLGDGKGGWRHWQEARFPPLRYDYGDVAAGDLDGDGKADLVLAAHLRGVFALRGDGAGGFTAWSRGLPARDREPAGPEGGARGDALPFTSRALALADWNRDGRLDILALAEGPTSARALERGQAELGKAVFLNRGDGSWETVSGPGALIGDAIVPADLDGDGRLDFVTDSRVVGSADLLNYGRADGSWRVAPLPEPRPRLRVYAVAVADFDADGRLDLALSFQARDGDRVRRGLDLYLAAPGGAGWRRLSVWADGADTTDTITALAAGDLDGDGRVDLAAGTAAGGLRLFLNEGGGDFALERTPEADPGAEHLGCAAYRVAIIDLDGDGRGELLAAYAGEPGSEVLLGQPARCRAQGALRIWKALAADPVPGPSGGPPGRSGTMARSNDSRAVADVGVAPPWR